MIFFAYSKSTYFCKNENRRKETQIFGSHPEILGVLSPEEVVRIINWDMYEKETLAPELGYYNTHVADFYVKFVREWDERGDDYDPYNVSHEVYFLKAIQDTLNHASLLHILQKTSTGLIMNLSTLNQKLKSLIGKTVVFNKNAEELEDYAEEGMKARILDFTIEDSEVTIIKFDFDCYKDHNAYYESSNYYDEFGKPTLNAHQAGCYEAISKMFFPSNFDEIFSYMVILSKDRKDDLHIMFREENTTETYLEWLENRLIEAEDQGFEIKPQNSQSMKP